MCEIYTDGSCRRDGTGGYGFIVVKNEEVIYRYVKREENTTNQRMELMALISAFKYCLKMNITEGQIFSDSAYCLNCARDRWYIRWERNGFKSTKGEPVKNQDLWEQLIPFFKNNLITLVKVAGHSTNYYNNFIDSLVTTISSSRTTDLTNKKFGLLMVKGIYGNKFTDGVNTTLWECECDCGKRKIVTHNNLLSKNTQSCGECLGERYKNLSEFQFGYLKPLQKVGKSEDNYAIWQCQCLNCGTIITVNSRLLRNGQISCGCIKSKGEYRIARILNELNIKYCREYCFKECCDILPLKFDFAILDNKDKVICLIEYQGEQHYKSSTNNNSWNTKEHLIKLQKHDSIKRNFCQEKGIPLIEIPYSDYDKINTDYLRRVMNYER